MSTTMNLSRPSTPPMEIPKHPNQFRFKYSYGPTEFPEAYRPGGYHPVDIGDFVGKYQVLHKLGYGSFATVWLARDPALSRLVAVKIKRAKDSVESCNEIAILRELEQFNANSPPERQGRFVSLLGTFQVTGPNGTHLCLVFEVMGPSLASFEFDDDGFRKTLPIPVLKKFLRHTLLGIQFIHDAGFIHGDIQQANILACPKDPERMRDGVVIQKNLKPCGDPLVRRDGKIDRWAPRFLVAPEPLQLDYLVAPEPLQLDYLVAPEPLQLDYRGLGSEFAVKICDFGSARKISDSKKEKPTTPVALRAPELVLHQQFGPSIDIWSFGCLVFELLAGNPLFFVYLMDDNHHDSCDDNHLVQMHAVLNELPSSFFDHWPRWRTYFRPDGTMFNNMISGDTPEVVEFDSLEVRLRDECPAYRGKMKAKEMDMVIDLIRSILKYDPAERPSAAEVLRHPWFEME